VIEVINGKGRTAQEVIEMFLAQVNGSSGQIKVMMKSPRIIKQFF
jgi:hypothetical protein